MNAKSVENAVGSDSAGDGLPEQEAARVASPRPTPLRGIALIMASTICFSSSDIVAKTLMETLPPTETAWLRYATFSLLLIPPVWRQSGVSGLRSERGGLQVLRGLVMVGSAVFFFLALQVMPVADTTAIFFISPILITAFAVLFLREQVGWRRWAAAFVGLIGVIVIIRPGTSAFQMATLLPLLGAGCWAGAGILTKMISGTDSPTTTLAYSTLAGLFVLTVLMPFVWITPTITETGLALLMGTLSAAGHVMLIFAYRHAGASVLAPFSYVQLIWAGTLGFAVFGTIPDAWTVAGAVIIASSGLYIAYRERIRAVRAG